MLSRQLESDTSSLTQRLGSRDVLARFDALVAARAVGKFRAELVPLVLQCIEEPNPPEIRLAAVDLIGNWPRPVPEVVPCLLTRLYDTNLFIRKAAILALGVHARGNSIVLDEMFVAYRLESSSTLRSEIICVIHELQNREALSETIIRRAASFRFSNYLPEG